MSPRIPEGFGNSSARPVVQRAPDPVARAGEVISWGLVAAGVAVAVMRSAGVGVSVGVGVGDLAAGSEAAPLSHVLTALGAWLLCLVPVTLLARHPRHLNYPAPVTEENAARVYRAGTRMLTWLGIAVSFTMLGVMLGTAGVVSDDAAGGLVAVGLVVVVGATIGGIIATSSAAQPRTTTSS